MYASSKTPCHAQRQRGTYGIARLDSLGSAPVPYHQRSETGLYGERLAAGLAPIQSQRRVCIYTPRACVPCSVAAPTSGHMIPTRHRATLGDSHLLGARAGIPPRRISGRCSGGRTGLLQSSACIAGKCIESAPCRPNGLHRCALPMTPTLRRAPLASRCMEMSQRAELSALTVRLQSTCGYSTAPRVAPLPERGIA